MALNETEAKSIAVRTIDSSDTLRARYEAACGLWLCYTYGSQWARLQPGTMRGGQSLIQLKSYIQPNKSNVRLAMNFIGGRVTKLNSRMMPRKIPYRVKPASTANNDLVGSLVADARLKQHIESTASVATLRRAYLWRMVLGSVVVRRTMSPAGPPIIVRDAAGIPINDASGRPKSIRTYEHKWGICPPYEIIRDPSARDTDFEQEDIIGHEKARTVDWIARKFGEDIKTTATMGQLGECQRFLHSAIGDTTLTGSIQDSRMPGVMVSEFWFKDSSSISKNPWPWHMIAWRDTCGSTPDERMLHVLQFGKNPYHGLPLHHFFYTPQLTSPWARGVPALTISAQDATNLAFVSMLRSLIHHGNPKWIVAANSLTEPSKDALVNTTNRPIEYHNGMPKPERMPSAPIDSIGAQILGETGGWLDEMLTMAPVQSGQAVARGEAAKAYEVRRDAADTPITAVIDGDGLVLKDLLAGTMHDIIKTDSVKVFTERLSHQFTREQIMTLKQQDSTVLLSGVEIDVDKLKPRTPTEAREDAAAAIDSQMLDPVSARRNLWIREGIIIDERECRAMQHQQQEIASILAEEQVDAIAGQYHEAHKYIISLEVDSPQFDQYTTEQQDAIMEHDRMHDELMMMDARVGASLADPNALEMGEEQEQQAGPEGLQQGLPPDLTQPTSDLVGQQPSPQMPQQGLSGLGLPSELPPGIGPGLQQQLPSAPIGVGI